MAWAVQIWMRVPGQWIALALAMPRWASVKHLGWRDSGHQSTPGSAGFGGRPAPGDHRRSRPSSSRPAFGRWGGDDVAHRSADPGCIACEDVADDSVEVGSGGVSPERAGVALEGAHRHARRGRSCPVHQPGDPYLGPPCLPARRTGQGRRGTTRGASPALDFSPSGLPVSVARETAIAAAITLSFVLPRGHGFTQSNE